MSRSLKKKPYVCPRLMKAVAEMTQSGNKKPIKTRFFGYKYRR